MKRKKVTRRIEADLEYNSLQYAIDRAKEIMAIKSDLILADFEIVKVYSYGDSVNIYLEYKDEETDAEMQARVDQEARWTNQRRLDYERLKKEFEGGSKA